MDVSEETFLVVFDHLLVLNVVGERLFVEGIRHDRLAIGEDMNVDVGPSPDMAGPNTADQARPEPREDSHEAERLDPHVADSVEPARPFVHPRHALNLVADLGVGGKVAGTMLVVDPELLGGLALGREVFGLGPMIHKLRGKKGDLPPNAIVCHEKKARRLCPSRRRWAKGAVPTSTLPEKESLP